MNAKAIKRRILRGMQSKYGLTSLVAFVWVTFAADIDLIHILQTAREVNALKQEVRRVESDAQQVRTDLDELMHDEAALERFARERYYMKRKNEDVYRLVPAAED